ncbi:hypothetical protein [Neisseria mucosa]|uniref:hypothetical protein n=1 Tax=Neisseria mucosa TaxID=488 RepID=UPI00156089C2|nr:hypothetical protein [Neisseria mucosa]QKI23240.1 hypothetical protein FOC66_00005 [Neisseria mucosa]
MKVAGGPSLTKSGIDAAGNKVTNVADGDLNATAKTPSMAANCLRQPKRRQQRRQHRQGINFGGTRRLRRC